uniref:Putative secreted protein n=1 Tax=Anopheles triannulatus TaxID=58253 RepID=A0A2M4B310_9DIPT
MPARSSRARCAIARSMSSFFSFSFWASFFSSCARASTASRAFRSAMYSASAILANFSLMCTCCNPRPSAASRLSSGMV